MSMAGLVSLTTWFDKKRPLAIGISTCMGGTGMFLWLSDVNVPVVFASLVPLQQIEVAGGVFLFIVGLATLSG